MDVKIKNIVFMVAFPFPFGEASSIRALNICKLLKYSGYNVHVIADFISESIGDADMYCTFQGCLSKQPPIYKRFQRPKAAVKALEKYCENNKVDIVLANARSDRFSSLVRLCRKKRLKLIIESCEWYDISSYKLGRFDWRYYINQNMIINGFKKVDGFISISKFLNDYNSSLGKKSIRIPTIMDVSKIIWKETLNNKKINIVYTGSPGTSKELLRPIIQALANNKVLQNKIVFHIYGPNIETVKKNIVDENLLSKVQTSVLIHGRVSQNQMPLILCNADYLIFIRPNRRSSNAGFPTKFGESMAAGTPVITNATGDIDLYLENGKNGFLLKDGSAETVQIILNKIIELGSDQIKIMRKNARKTAEKNFDYHHYINEIKKIFD